MLQAQRCTTLSSISYFYVHCTFYIHDWRLVVFVMDIGQIDMGQACAVVKLSRVTIINRQSLISMRFLNKTNSRIVSEKQEQANSVQHISK